MHIISKKIVYITFLNSYKIQVINWTCLKKSRFMSIIKFWASVWWKIMPQKCKTSNPNK